MAGWVHRHVIMDQEVIQATPTPKTLFLVEVQSHTSMSGVLTNTSLAQDMAVEVSESWDGVTRWASPPRKSCATPSRRRAFAFVAPHELMLPR